MSWRISAFSNLADPCFSKADGTRRLNSDKLWLMRSRRLFSIIPRLLLRVMLPPVLDAPQDSFNPSPGEEQLKVKGKVSDESNTTKTCKIRTYSLLECSSW